MRFLLDENLPPEIAQMIRLEGHEASEVIASGMRSSADSDIWDFAAREQMVLVSRDTDFPLRRGPAPAGLVLLRPRGVDNKAAIVRMFRDFCDSAGLALTPGSLIVLEPGRPARIGRLPDA